MGIFDGCKISLVRRTFSPARLHILGELIHKHGTVSISSSICLGGEAVDGGICVVDPQRIENIHKGERLYSVDWISDSISTGKLLPKEKYLINTKRFVHGESKELPDPEGSGPHKKKRLAVDLPVDYANSAYDCQRKTPLVGQNEELCSLLQRIEQQRYVAGNEQSALSYQRAISAIRAYPHPIVNATEAAAIKGIGSKISSLVSEFLQTGKIREVEELENNAEFHSLVELTGIYGVGPLSAKKFLSQGITSVEQLRAACAKGKIKLKNDQKIGLEYYEDMQKPIDRPGVEMIAQRIKDVIRDGQLPECRVEIVGGYRRGKTHNNDADILISPLYQEGIGKILSDIVDSLLSTGHVAAIMNFSKESTRTKSTATMDRLDRCLCIYRESEKEPFHRLDMVISPKSQFFFALLGWTGSRQFERSIRLYADHEKGMMLSSHELTDKHNGTSHSVSSEEEIFRLLDLEYIEPRWRNC